jgi:hypothetical protein
VIRPLDSVRAALARDEHAVCVEFGIPRRPTALPFFRRQAGEILRTQRTLTPLAGDFPDFAQSSEQNGDCPLAPRFAAPFAAMR